jgi:tRNA(Ile)-lysidine synthase
VAVSGGPDSVALLHLLYRLRPEWDLDLGVGHFDHRLRRESQDDAAWVANLAGSLGLPCHLGRGEVQSLARAARISLQMEARKLRLDFLKNTCRQRGYSRLALGHTANDQVELFWLSLLRGAGSAGLKGMPPATPEGLVRPLLAVGKAPLLAFLRETGLSYREDASNLSRAYLRNRLRLDLLPLLRRQYNPRLDQTIWRTQVWLQEDERLLARDLEAVWATVGKTLAPGLISLNLPRLLALEPAWQRRVLRGAVKKIAADLTLTASQVNSLLALARGARSGGLISLGGVLQVARAGPELHLLQPLPPPAPGAVVLTAPGAQVDTVDGWRWRLSTREYQAGDLWSLAPDTARLSLEQVTFPLTVRYFQAGDRFWPRGAPGPKKLQDFLVNAKIPRWLRPHIPLVVSGVRTIWVAGLRVAEPVAWTPTSPRVLEIQLFPTSPHTQRVWEFLLAVREP